MPRPRCWDAPSVTILDKIPPVESQSVFPPDPQPESSLRNTVTGHLAPAGRNRKSGSAGRLQTVQDLTPDLPFPHSPPYLLLPPFIWGMKGTVSPQLSQEAFLQGHKDEPALPLFSPCCLPGHLVKPGTGPRESPGSLLYRQGTGDERSSWKALRYRCGVGTAKSFCISSGKFSSFHFRGLIPGHFLDTDLTVVS